MPRRVEIFVPAHLTKELIEEIQHLNGLINLQIAYSAAIKPPGDVITLELTNRSVNRLLRLLDQHGVGRDGSGSITTSEPFSLVSSSLSTEISKDINDAPWEEMISLIETETNMNVNMIILMFIAGIITVVGIATNAIHVVVGAMVIAPGFQPIVAIALGIVAQSADWRNGLVNMAKGYGALLLGAAIATIVLSLGTQPIGSKPSYLEAGSLLAYWSNLTVTSVIVSLVAGVAGAILIATRRSVLTSGVMIALALVPSAALVSIGVCTGRLDMAGKGLLRWLIEAGLVITTSALVFIWKRVRVQRRKMLP